MAITARNIVVIALALPGTNAFVTSPCLRPAALGPCHHQRPPVARSIPSKTVLSPASGWANAVTQPRAQVPQMNLAAQARSALNVVLLAFVASLVISPVSILCFMLDLFGGLLKLLWRLQVLFFIFRLVAKPLQKMAMQIGLRVMLAGGPIKAMKGAFFGTFASVFADLASFLSGRGPFNGLANFFGKLARGCDDRMPAGGGMGDMASAFGGMGGMGGADGMGDMADMASAFGGMGGMGDSSPFGDAGSAEDLLGGLFGASAGNTGGEGGGGLFGPAAGPLPPSAPPAPFVAAASEGVKINVRKPGQAKSSPPPASPPPPAPPAPPAAEDVDESP